MDLLKRRENNPLKKYNGILGSKGHVLLIVLFPIMDPLST